MYKISNFYSNQHFKSKKFKKNLKDTKNIFKEFKLDLKKNKFSFF